MALLSWRTMAALAHGGNLKPTCSQDILVWMTFVCVCVHKYIYIYVCVCVHARVHHEAPFKMSPCKKMLPQSAGVPYTLIYIYIYMYHMYVYTWVYQSLQSIFTELLSNGPGTLH